MYPLDDTIVAIASPPGGAARGIVRLSGPESASCVAQFFQPDAEAVQFSSPGPRSIAGKLCFPDLSSPLPCDVYVWADQLWRGRPACTGAGETPAPQVRSYTGQPLVEIHTIGSPPLLQLALRALCAAGARLAEPGEFTLRAFLSGRIDLTQAEAVLGVIDAAGPRDLDIALSQLAGGLSHPLRSLRDALLDLLAHIEAGFDFADEDLPFITRAELDRQLAEAENSVSAILAQTVSRGEPTDVVRAVLVGRPNVGKSSLFNRLSGKHAALVSEHPGTTRDYLVAELDLDGVKCRLIDMAGARGEGREERGEGREKRGSAEQQASPLPVGEGQQQMSPLPLGEDQQQASPLPLGEGQGEGRCSIESGAQSAADLQRRQSQVQVLCLDATRPLDEWEREEIGRFPAAERIVVLTKCDGPRRIDCTHNAVETSSRTGQGIDTLREELRRAALAVGGAFGDVVAGTAVRCCESLRLAAECLHQARHLAVAAQEELAAAEIRLALEELGKVVGAVYTDDVLDRIFSRFCVGK